MNEKDPGQRLYENYCHHCNWLSYAGKPLPQWHEARDDIKAHWAHVEEQERKHQKNVPGTFAFYHRMAAGTAIYPGRRPLTHRYTPLDCQHSEPMSQGLNYAMLGLVGETGEIAEKVKKIIRDKSGILSPEDRRALAKEIGDVLWYLDSVAHELEFTLEDCADINIAKLAARQSKGVLKGSGDDREEG